jgi:hypothetical protein
VAEGSGGGQWWRAVAEGSGRGQWRKRFRRELEELYNEPHTVKVIKPSRLRWAGHVVRMDDNEIT